MTSATLMPSMRLANSVCSHGAARRLKEDESDQPQPDAADHIARMNKKTPTPIRT